MHYCEPHSAKEPPRKTRRELKLAAPTASTASSGMARATMRRQYPTQRNQV